MNEEEHRQGCVRGRLRTIDVDAFQRMRSPFNLAGARKVSGCKGHRAALRQRVAKARTCQLIVVLGVQRFLGVVVKD
ncbi:Uncharacterised protein [Mycobacteroides abscessus subsp. abscessus]|nr:Uncharacterised protein [Mycobacteroides abscessus subsp. abscessus]